MRLLLWLAAAVADACGDTGWRPAPPRGAICRGAHCAVAQVLAHLAVRLAVGFKDFVDEMDQLFFGIVGVVTVSLRCWLFTDSDFAVVVDVLFSVCKVL